MKIAKEYSHRQGLQTLKEKGLELEVREIVNMPEIKLIQGKTKQIKNEVKKRLSTAGWVIEPHVLNEFKTFISGMKNRIGLTVQTGNIARAFYDLMKFEFMHKNGSIDGAVLIVPTAEAAKILGSNIADFNRVTSELGLFRHIITVQSLIFGVDEN